MSDQNDDHLSPELLSSYADNQEVTKDIQNEVSDRQNDPDVAGPFTRTQLEKQIEEREVPTQEYILTPNGLTNTGTRNPQQVFNERQIAYREEILSSNQDMARDGFNAAHVTEPFRKADLEKQKSAHEFSEQQIEHREKVLDSLQNKARDDFTIADKVKDRELER
ncbi:MAG: hypothetical protein ABW160_04260 [Candidatus Thiodiazotropha sp. 4PDIV1]